MEGEESNENSGTKNIITKIKNSIEELDSSLDTAEQILLNGQQVSIKNMQIKAQWDKKPKNIKKSVRNMRYSKKSNIHVIGIPGGGKRGARSHI